MRGNRFIGLDFTNDNRVLSFDVSHKAEHKGECLADDLNVCGAQKEDCVVDSYLSVGRFLP